MDNRNPARRRFHNMHGVITGAEAQSRYPNPAFFMRPDMRQSVAELRAILHRNCDEAERIIPMLRASASFKTKAPILDTAQRLHDFRVSINMHGGELGRPYLWEV